MYRFLVSLLALATLPGIGSAQFLDRWHEWGHGYGYGRSGFDVGKPGSAFSTLSWQNDYYDSINGHNWSPRPYYYNPTPILEFPVVTPTPVQLPKTPTDRAVI